MKKVDAKGKLCPMPLIMTKKALDEISENETLEIQIDNETSLKNVVRFLEDHGMKVKVEKEGGIYEIIVSKTGIIPESAKEEEYCEIENPRFSNYVISFQKNKLGEGNDELGEILIKAFVNTLPNATLKPKTMVFLNSGIFLAVKNSPVLDALINLEKIGVEILVCGTCLDFYQKKTDLAVGKISNMYDIIESLSQAGNVIYP